MEENVKRTIDIIVTNTIAQLQNDVYFEYPELRHILELFISEWGDLGYKLAEKYEKED
mgnify:CR=1 FL=1